MDYCKKCNNVNDIQFVSNLPKYYCSYCGNSEDIKENQIIYVHKSTNELKNLVLNVKEKKNDPILPRTRNYICPNKKCGTHQNEKLREAVFFRPIEKSFQTIYLCCECDKYWPVSSQ